MREKFFIFLIFILGFILGFGFRLNWFYVIQKKILEYQIIDKPLREAKGGGKTPQETWIGYLNALEKGDINGALEYIWPDSREKFRKELLLLKNAGLLTQYAKNHDKNINEIYNPETRLEENEKMFSLTYLDTKEISLLLSGLAPFPEIIKESERIIWERKGVDQELSRTDFIFKFNPYTKKWLIKE